LKGGERQEEKQDQPPVVHNGRVETTLQMFACRIAGGVVLAGGGP